MLSRLATRRSSRLARTLTTSAPPAAAGAPSAPAVPAAKPWKGLDTTNKQALNLVGGEWTAGNASEWFDVHDPSTQEVVLRAPQTSHADMVKIVDRAEEAFLDWSQSSVLRRQAVMLKLQALIRTHHDDLARQIVLEQGKTFADAKGDVLRGLQVVDMACAAPSTLLGKHIEVSRDMDTYTRRVPLGVGAAICPHNFPAMIPLWSLPVALISGNSLILKPSERVPGTANIIAELAEQAGLPKGAVSIMNGGRPTVNFLCNEPRIKAISFVGGDLAGKHIYDTAGANGKRVQANLGAKNHCILMPDADRNGALNAIAGAAFGAAGQRCMALSVLVTVGETNSWVGELVEKAKALKVGNGFDPEVEVGPVISPTSKARIEQLIGTCAEQGGKVLLDGRGVKVDGYPDGNWVGPTILEADTSMDCYTEEIFGPVLTVVKAKTLEDAIALVNKNKYGNGAAIFTKSGAAARHFESTIQAGQVGVNVAIPVPLPMFAWSGNKASVLGPTSLYGELGVEFWTQHRTITAAWRATDDELARASVSMPTHS